VLLLFVLDIACYHSMCNLLTEHKGGSYPTGPTT